MDAELQRLLDAAAKAPPMTAAQIREQRISFIYGQLSGRVGKDEIRRNLARMSGEDLCWVNPCPDAAPSTAGARFTVHRAWGGGSGG